MTSSLDFKAFAKLRRIVPNQLAANRSGTNVEARPLPEEISFKLTNRCDLRCTHCYQWGDEGYHRSLVYQEQKQDLPLTVIAKVMEATRSTRSNVFLWGGEPLVYREWAGLVELLAQDPRWTSLCTNGTLLPQRLPSLRAISQHLELSVSLDGFEAQHDAFRGQGSFARSMSGLRAVVAERHAGSYRGELSVNCVMSDGMIPHLLSFVKLMEAEGVETLYLSFPWFISKSTAAAMDAYVARHFPHLPAAGGTGKPSWHSFTFQLGAPHIEALRAELRRLLEAPLGLKLRFNPTLSDDDLEAFLAGSDKPAQGKTRCLALYSRLDVFPNGEAVSCKFFPEFTVGNLATASLDEVWRGQAYERVRETVSSCGLMPACAKCNLLYTRGA